MSDVSPSEFGETPVVEVGPLREPELEVDVGRDDAYPHDVLPRSEEPGR